MLRVMPLTWLFVPADRPDRVAKALASGAHAVIVDLEDAVAPASKDAARDGLRKLFATAPPVQIHIRVNGFDTQWGEDDLRAAAALPVHGVTLPKIEHAKDAAAALSLLGGELALHCMVETPLGVEHAFEIASSAGVRGISLGELDLRAQTGAGDEGLNWARSRVINASVAAGLGRPPQSVYPHVADLDGLAAWCARGRELGFLGATAIHPRQLPVIEAAYVPTDEEASAAREVVAAAAEHGPGGFAVGGRFVDAPIVSTAEQVVALAERYGTRGG